MNDQEFIVQKIRSQYTEPEHTQLDALKDLDKKVKRPAIVAAYVVGIISALVMGSGMSLVMTDIGAQLGWQNTMVPGIIIGVIGMGMALLTYPLYTRILGSRRKKYAEAIIQISDQMLKG